LERFTGKTPKKGRGSGGPKKKGRRHRREKFTIPEDKTSRFFCVRRWSRKAICHFTV